MYFCILFSVSFMCISFAHFGGSGLLKHHSILPLNKLKLFAICYMSCKYIFPGCHFFFWLACYYITSLFLLKLYCTIMLCITMFQSMTNHIYKVVPKIVIPYFYYTFSFSFCFWDGVLLCLPDWSAVAQSLLTVTSASWVQVILLPQPPT